MNTPELPFKESATEEVGALIETLHKTGERLEKLTSGEVDTVADRRGRPFMLRRSQDLLRESQAVEQAELLNAVPAQIALLDPNGVIVQSNDAWRLFSGSHPLHGPRQGIGSNYLDYCERGSGGHVLEAHKVARGIRSVLAGHAQRFDYEYSIPSAVEQRWFRLSATPLGKPGITGVVMMHLDISIQRSSEEALLRFGSAMDAIGDAIYLVDRDTMSFIHVNEAACRSQSQSHDELFALGPESVLNTPRAELEQAYDALIESNTATKPVEILKVRRDGSRYWIELRRHALRSAERWTIVTLVRDITERKLAEEKIERLNRVYAVLSGINTLIVRVRDRLELLREACRIAVEDGKFRMAWTGIVDREAMKIVPVASTGAEPDFLALIKDRFSLIEDEPFGKTMSARAVREKRTIVSNRIHEDPRIQFGKEHTARGICSMAVLPLQVDDEVVGVLSLYAAEPDFFDATEMKLLTELSGDIGFALDHLAKADRLSYLAYYDGITGLPNRALFLDRVSQHVHSQEGAPSTLALALIDINRFRAINDTLGRQAGDDLLKLVARRIEEGAPEFTTIARIGVDIFGVVVRDAHDAGGVALDVEQLLRACFGKRFKLNGSDLMIAGRAGIALFPLDGDDAETLLRNAEAALKRSRGSAESVLFYSPEMNTRVAAALNLESKLRTALDLDQFVLHYQPKVSLTTGKLCGAEALIRWNDPELGLVAPGQFIPILEETGLIYEVGRWALRKAIDDYLHWRREGLPAVRIAVNVSPLQLRHRGFVSEIEQAISVDENAAAGLELEITESLVMENITHTIACLEAIRAMKVTVAMDDFGTGFSSLGHLSKLPVDTLKIDRTFVVEMTNSAQGLALVSTIISLARSLKLKVIAEGVETEEQARLLRLLCCDEMQGFLFSKPLPRSLFESRFLCPPASPTPAA